MEIFLVTSYRKIGKAKLSQRMFIDRANRQRRKQRLAFLANEPNGSLHTLICLPGMEFRGLVGSHFGCLSVKIGDSIQIRPDDEFEPMNIEPDQHPQSHVPAKFLQSLGVNEATIAEIKKFQKLSQRSPIIPQELIIYKDMIVLSHEKTPRLFIGGEEITFVKLINFPGRRGTVLYGAYQCTTNEQFAISYMYSHKTVRSGCQVLDLQKMRSLIQWQMEKIVEKSTKKPNSAYYLWDCLTGSFDQEQVPPELNPVLHQYPRTGLISEIYDYLPGSKRLVHICSGSVTINRVRRGRPLYQNHEHSLVKVEARIQTHLNSPRCATVAEERYLFILSDQVYHRKFAIACVDLEQKSCNDCYALEFAGQKFVETPKSIVCRRKSELTVLRRTSQQNYFHVLVAGFQSGLLLFTYYEKRFGLSGVFNTPDGKKSSIPVSLCPSSCGKFCYAYTSSEIYRVVIKPDKLL